ncbi:DUF692 domain-containing protein [Pendulispora albinea]|uniref:DUF692 domain-containing protein n=1 Tax=Pendulispora albinea TaxID=2741071 RepID=A0ABZ2M2X5_9BACT
MIVREFPRRGGVGIGWRPEIAVDLLRERTRIDFVEVVAETCFTQRHLRREASALAEIWPVIPHGVKLSLGSAEGVDMERARRLGALARELGAPFVTEHVAFTRAGGREIGHLTELPRTRDAVRLVARNVARARAVLPDVPLLLENVAWSFRWPEDEMDEPSFYGEIVRATGCDLLLDVSNLYANARNEGVDPARRLEQYPLENVRMVHIAGGVEEAGFYFDTHAHSVNEDVFALVAALFARKPDVPVLLERDADFGAFDGLRAELERVRDMQRTDTAIPRASSLHDVRSLGDAGDAREPSAKELESLQAQVAALLIDVAPPAGALAERIGLSALARARAILQRKRVDDALPLLASLARSAEIVRPLATGAMERHARLPRGAGPADAWRIVQAALEDPRLRDDARIDRLVLRARFSGPDEHGALEPRWGPFFGFERLSDGRRVSARKGFGALAAVRLHERKRTWPSNSRSSPNRLGEGSTS